MAPSLNSTEEVYINHTVAVQEVPFAVVLSIIVALIFFLIAYAICCIEGLKGRFDLSVNKETGAPFNQVKIINPFKKMPNWRNFSLSSNNPFTRFTDNHTNPSRSDTMGIVLEDHLSHTLDIENHTDTDTC